MKETRFIAQNKEKWQESENLLKNSERDPEKLSSLFTQVIDDLSYSRTYYPNRSVRVYLNKIARQYFSVIYSHHRSRRGAFRSFWLDELPHIVWRSRKPLLLSLIIFLFAVVIGVFSSMKDPQFASSILGDRYVEMTKANIEKGDPMAVYKQGHQVDMFLGITFNNLMVAFRAFVFGIFLSVGTVAVLLYNGIMVGCFQFFFIERGLFAESALTIWLHGTLEISSIILAGGAGLTLGSGLLFPGTYSRLQAFQISATRSLKLMLGISPVFVLAAIIESFLTRYTDVPSVVRLFLILLSAGFIIGYFVIFPWMKARRGFERPLAEAKLSPGVEEPPNIGRIKNNAEILRDTFVWYKKFGGQLFRWVAVVTFFMVVAELLAPEPRTQPMNLLSEWWQRLFQDLFYAVKTPSGFYLALNTMGSSLVVYRALRLLDGDVRKRAPRSRELLSLVQTILVMSGAYALIFLVPSWADVLIFGAFPVLFVMVFAQLTGKMNVMSAIAEGSRVCAGNFGQVVGMQFVLLVLSVSFLVVLSAPLLYTNISILRWNFAESDTWSKYLVDFVEIYARLFAFNLLLPVLAGSAAYLYFSLKEIVYAQQLRDSIARLDNKYANT